MKPKRLPALATILSLAACYGTLLVLAALGAMGIAINLNEGIWAGVIVAFAGLATAGLWFGRRRHGSNLPLILGVLGTFAVTYAMFVDFSRIVEVVGFLLLIGAAVLDWRAG